MAGFESEWFRAEMKDLAAEPDPVTGQRIKAEELIFKLAFERRQYKDLKKLFDDVTTENAALKGQLNAMIHHNTSTGS